MRVILPCVLAATSAAAFAGPTGCCVIPVADILKHREVFAYCALAGNERNIDKKAYHFNSVNVGLFDRVELGYDNDFEGSTVYHAKLNVVEGTKSDYGVSVGWMNWDTRAKYGEPYVCARYGLPSGTRFHLGTVRTDRWRVMAGVDHGVGDWTFALDWMSGPNGYTWTGFTYNVAKAPGLSVSAYVGLPSVRSDGIQHQLYVNYAFKF